MSTTTKKKPKKQAKPKLGRPGLTPPEDRQRVCAFIKSTRIKLGINQDQAAEWAGVHRTTWYRWENGSRRIEDDARQAIAQALDIAPSRIYRLQCD